MNAKPEGPTPPSGYRWLENAETVWPTDVRIANDGVTLLSAAVMCRLWCPAHSDGEFVWLRKKITQPDLAWLKSKSIDQAKLHPRGSVERERITWAITEAVRVCSDSLMALVPEREQWRPGQKGGEA